ncbi:hypothetical protein [Planobispora rosea]|uniref:hypothetical protein n=1 Tax=Planobispora rosea TaxID=35762 RepID=UPI00083AEFCE|nr:hypothetical protein [Planobispora rosea]
MTGRRIFITLGTLTLLLSGCGAIRVTSIDDIGSVLAVALIGIGWMIGAVAMALVEQRGKIG